MARKQPKVAKIYQDLDRSRESLKLVLVLDKTLHEWHKYRPGTPILLMNAGPVYNGWTEFADSKTTEEFHDLHQALFKKVPAKSMTKDDVSLMCWAHMVTHAKDRTHLPTKEQMDRRKSGQRGGPRESLLTRKYSLKNPVDSGVTLDIPPQAMVCLRILTRAIKDNGGEYVTEEDLKKAVVKAAEEKTLVTRQDPWRIFQYYRPTLLRMGLISHD